MNTDNQIQASILDRLIDLEPATSQEPVQRRIAGIGQVKNQVKRDLENLLNTRCGRKRPPDRYRHTGSSVIHYGLGDYSAESPSSSVLIDRILKDVEWALRQFEPRIRDPRVELVVDDNAKSGLSFRIAGLLVVDPIREPVMFDTYYDSTRKGYVVSD